MSVKGIASVPLTFLTCNTLLPFSWHAVSLGLVCTGHGCCGSVQADDCWTALCWTAGHYDDPVLPAACNQLSQRCGVLAQPPAMLTLPDQQHAAGRPACTQQPPQTLCWESCVLARRPVLSSKLSWTMADADCSWLQMQLAAECYWVAAAGWECTPVCGVHAADHVCGLMWQDPGLASCAVRQVVRPVCICRGQPSPHSWLGWCCMHASCC